MDRTVLVTGAGGLVGRAVVNELKKGHWRIRGMTHSSGNTEKLISQGCHETAVGDVTDFPSMAAAASGVDAIIHSVGLLVEKGRLTYKSVNLGGSVNAIRAAEASAVKRFVMMSVVGLKAGDPNPYSSSKWDAELAVKASNLDWTMLRCSYIVGKGAPVLGVFKQLSALPVVPIIGGGTQLLQMVSVNDVATCLVKALDQEETINQTYELCGPVPMTYDETIDLVARIHGKNPPRKIHFPAGLVKAGLPIAEMLPGSIVSRATIDMLLRDSVCDPRRASEVFGIDITPIDVAMREAYGIA